MHDFYDEAYVEPGDLLGSELPDDEYLSQLMSDGFIGSGKDFSYHVEILRALHIGDGAKLLDFGSSWGYASWQFARAGFQVTSYEISKLRASYGSKLGLYIESDINKIDAVFDAVYSCHVLEHTPNPREALLRQLSLVKPGGLVVAHTPNGGAQLQADHYAVFHRTWGMVHPVLLSESFVAGVAGERPFICTSDDRPENLAEWDRVSQVRQPTDAAGMFFAIRAGQS